MQRAPGFPCALVFETEDHAQLGRIAPRDRGLMWGNLIARSKATKQSILTLCGEMDRFAERVIGRAFARPVGCNDEPLPTAMDDGGPGDQLGQPI